MLGVCHFCNSGFNVHHPTHPAWFPNKQPHLHLEQHRPRPGVELGPEPAVSPSVATDASGRLRLQ
jgi:hypothetical protein